MKRAANILIVLSLIMSAFVFAYAATHKRWDDELKTSKPSPKSYENMDGKNLEKLSVEFSDISLEDKYYISDNKVRLVNRLDDNKLEYFTYDFSTEKISDRLIYWQEELEYTANPDHHPALWISMIQYAISEEKYFSLYDKEIWYPIKNGETIWNVEKNDDNALRLNSKTLLPIK